jgi:hypothetical protein
MAERRSLSEALSLSPEKLAFIQGSDGSSGSGPPRRKRKADTKTIELGPPDEPDEGEAVGDVAAPRPRRQRQRSAESAPSVDEVLDGVLVPLTTRLPHRLVQSLRRICLEQKLKHAKPDSIQEVVETALVEWLSKRLR